MKMEESVVYMWGYLPGASLQGSPLLSPVPVALPTSTLSEDSWKDVCGGGCGFAVAISGDSWIYSFSIASSVFQKPLCCRLRLVAEKCRKRKEKKRNQNFEIE